MEVNALKIITNVLPVDLVKDQVHFGFPTFSFEVFDHPINKVIFEDSFNELVEDVWGDQFIDICTREMLSEWLKKAAKGLRDNIRK